MKIEIDIPEFKNVNGLELKWADGFSIALCNNCILVSVVGTACSCGLYISIDVSP